MALEWLWTSPAWRKVVLHKGDNELAGVHVRHRLIYDKDPANTRHAFRLWNNFLDRVDVTATSRILPPGAPVTYEDGDKVWEFSSTLAPAGQDHDRRGWEEEPHNPFSRRFTGEIRSANVIQVAIEASYLGDTYPGDDELVC